MAIIYVRSTDGNNADSGATWALAKQTLDGADAIDVAGDTIYVSQAHAESTAATVSLAFAGTITAPTKIICVNDGAEPPTAVATTGAVAVTGASNIEISGNVYVYGLAFNLGSAANSSQFFSNTPSAKQQVYEQCSFNFITTNSGVSVLPNYPNVGQKTKWVNCNVTFANAGQRLIISGGDFHWNGGSVLAGTSPAVLINNYDVATTGVGGDVLIENVDFSNCSSTMDLSNTVQAPYHLVIRNCKLPASWVGNLLNSVMAVPNRAEMHNCDSGATNYRLWVEDYFGAIKSETTLVRTGGASDGTTTLSWKMISSANAVYPNGALASPEFVVWNSTTGSSKTVTVEILHDSATNLTDKEVWLEVRYLSASGTPLGAMVTDCAASFLTTAADQTDSSETWTTTGMGNPNTQKLSVSFTPQMKGYIHCTVMLAKASTVIYVDPKATVS